jgi:hypothetical protein
MALVKNVEKRIWDIEGFDVAIKHPGGRNLRSDKKKLPMYPFEVALKNDCTIAQWINSRFRPKYSGFEVDVLDGFGNVVRGNTKLGNVRDTYLEED